AIAFYIGFAVLFFFVGSYMYAQALEIWFQGTYRSGRDISLVVGGFLFWNTMYLLRFGLFVLIAAVSSAIAIHPIKVLGALGAVSGVALQLLSASFGNFLNQHLLAAGVCALGALVLMAFENELLDYLRKLGPLRRPKNSQEEQQREALEQ